MNQFKIRKQKIHYLNFRQQKLNAKIFKKEQKTTN